MAEANISDLIEQYLKEILSQDEITEIKRSEIASRFAVVPSQINYVINTRFTLQNGYIVESKRGGGGYIRIEHVDLVDDTKIFDELIDYIGNSIGNNNADQIITALLEDKVVSEREANLMVAAIDKNSLRISDKVSENTVRARVLVGMINRLRFESTNIHG
ncbi:CtsR family transcriptional regulator [Oenococcus oeni]|uniref:CtsR family transcriptional regulator n=1 Tax=Oenococcus oeni TaxID=1247 RepID=UPI0008F90D4D|nr:CtsR family transcriptional regulator [Oenococcus oeni]OIM01092.1 CtsR family transcriptional regulator [Oenococcus oeni]